jgi:predicted O-linked N-acetylglucosamine transferase (SPINDLY family)
MACHRAGQLPQAEALYRQVLQAVPNHADALHLLGVVACQSGRHTAAIELVDQAILAKPGAAEFHATRANALLGLQQPEAALASFDRAIGLKPELAEAHCDRGATLLGLRRYAEAVESYDRAIQLRPTFVGAHYNRGVALNALGRYQAAVASFDQALQLQPGHAEAHHHRGVALYFLGEYQAALDSLDRAILDRPDYAEAYSVRGSALNELHQDQAAVASFDRALQLNPNDATAHANRANALLVLRRYREAIESCNRALQLNPGFVEVWANRGNAFYALGQLQQAQQDYNESIRLKPDYAEAWNNLGALLDETPQHQAALGAIDRAIQLQPNVAKAYLNRGNVLMHLKQYPLALENFTQALRLNPNCDYVAGMRLNVKRDLCDWENIEAEWREVEARIDREERAAAPFVTLALSGSPALQRKAAEIYARDRYPAPADATPIPRREQRDRIRIGYYSADFRQHAVCLQTIDVFERHDHSQFEIIGFAFGLEIEDDMTRRVSAAMDRFIDVRSLSDVEVADLSRTLEVDVAVDLMAFTEHGRPGIFAQRAAPIQVNYLGYPATSGAGYIDYLIADSTLVPRESRQHYSEKIVTMPDSFQANSRNPISEKQYTRGEQGLPEHGFVFCCFNGSYKIGPATFAAWMRILGRVEGSVLWLLGGHPLTEANLRKQAAHHGIDPERLVFAQRLPLPEHLSRQRLAGLFLDTLPFNAGATASPALWAGLPVLTCMGETFAGRMGASLLRALDLPELITESESAYEALAVELALDPARLQNIRDKLAQNRLTTPLFDPDRFTQNLEAAYTAMLRRYHAGMPPGDIHVASSSSSPQPGPASPDSAEFHTARGNALYALRQYREAVASFDRAIRLNPGFAIAHSNRGSALSELQQYPAALESFDRAIQLNPDYAEAHSNRANALHVLHRYSEAVASCDRALEIDPNLAEAWNNRGNSRYALQQYREAQHDFNQCIRLNPGFAQAHNNLGSALSGLRQYQAALDAIDRAILLQPGFAEAHNNRGNVLQHREQYPLALESFTRALQLDPACDYVAGTRLHMKRFLCDWQDFEAECRQVETRIDRNQRAAIPFATLALTDSPALQRKAAETYIRHRYPAPAGAAPIPLRPRRGKIRIGYFSADFHRHAVSYLIADLFERHDRSRFEVFGFSFTQDARDPMTDRIAAAMDTFVDVLALSDREVVDLSRKLEVDIAVDLMGLTKHHRPGIFALRAAPIQVNYLGYPGTMGADYIDYLIADPTLIPESAQCHYSEKIAYLPDTYQANDSQRPISAIPATRAAEHLPEDAFVFCCFNAANKISPPVFDIWMRILSRVPGSVLWLLGDLPLASANLRSHAARRGIAPERLIFARPLPLAEHLARERLAHLFLDTFPYTAHTTASDALWAGVPVLTRSGETFASRVAASLLHAIDLPELIATTSAEYERLAIELALHPERLRHLRERLARNRLTAPLFDSAAFTRHIEAAYTAMHARYLAGLPPATIYIPHSPAAASE